MGSTDIQNVRSIKLNLLNNNTYYSQGFRHKDDTWDPLGNWTKGGSDGSNGNTRNKHMKMKNPLGVPIKPAEAEKIITLKVGQ